MAKKSSSVRDSLVKRYSDSRFAIDKRYRRPGTVRRTR